MQNLEILKKTLKNLRFSKYLRFSIFTNSVVIRRTVRIFHLKLELLKPFLGTKFDTTMTQELNSLQKHELLNMILDYFKLHLHAFKHPRSLTILNQVFS